MKTQKIKLSHTYINEYGEIVERKSKIAIFYRHFLRILTVLPFAVSFSLCGLFVMEGCCLVGLIRSLSYSAQSEYLGVYLFLSTVIALIGTIGFAIGNYLVQEQEKQSLPVKNTRSSMQKQKNNHLDIL